jgi:hypothetical protein
MNEQQYEKIVRCRYTGCWWWLGELNRNGYGRVWHNGKKRMVHKVTWESVHGPVPEGLVLDHKCRNRRCCNPRHLEPVTVQVNTRRGGAILFGDQHEM